MPYFNWTTEFSVNNDIIDEQHKMIFEYANNLHESIQTGRSKEIVDDLVSKLLSYSQNHFADEEKLMKEYEYPDIENHLAEHEKFVARVSDYRNNFNLTSRMTALDILNFLKEWLVNHILVADKKYMPFIKGK
ncbi:MAG: hemerythrin [Ignavibacteriales bacterium]|nr:MAG: hemerythrin [Ignavibacteriales bacterium]